MPTYEYICKACQHEFESFHSIKADPISVCPKCRKKKVARKLGIGGAVIFKGGGFYETDYRSESYKRGETDASKATEEKGAATTTSDAKTDAKSDAVAAPTTAKPSTETKSTDAAAAKPAAPSTPSKESAPAKDSRATHPSRVGRGRGNIVQSAAKANAPKKPASRGKKSK
ncbi:MAG: hypothetical protein EXS10_07075 [Phycisphaerales bacterium]|nr:hypothetical protein [Phycisphaerales bacterium]